MEELTLNSLRTAIREKHSSAETDAQTRFEAVGRRFESAVTQLIGQVKGIVGDVPELHVTLEDEIEIFCSPAFPDRTMEIHDQRLRITLDEERRRSPNRRSKSRRNDNASGVEGRSESFSCFRDTALVPKQAHEGGELHQSLVPRHFRKCSTNRSSAPAHFRKHLHHNILPHFIHPTRLFWD